MEYEKTFVRAMRDRLEQGILKSVPNCFVTGDPGNRLPNTCNGIPFTAAHGTVRFSLSRYNDMQEIERVIEAVPPIVAQLRKLSPYWGEDGPLEGPEKAFAPAYA